MATGIPLSPSIPFVYHDNTETFESTVRPWVKDSFRPVYTPVSRPLPELEQGKFAFTGASSQVETLSQSTQSSWSKSKPVEVEREVTVQRIKQKEPDGTVNEENYVDVEHTTKMTMQEGSGAQTTYYYAPPPVANNIETIEENVVIPNPNAPPPASGGAAP